MSITSAINLFRQLSVDESQPSGTTQTRQVNEACFDYLFMEMVHTLRSQLQAHHPVPDDSGSVSEQASATDRGSRTSASNTHDMPSTREVDEQLLETLYYKIELIGFRIGQRLAERYSKDRPRFVDTLDIVKFICRDIWTKLFRKQIDNLKTNHRGVYTLQDSQLRWLTRMSGDEGTLQATQQAIPYLWLPCGIIRGIMANHGLDATVTFKDLSLPQCTFHIKLNKPS
ncbi:hypothetical protein IWQ62_002247 [Dispira parvispora]|uniref:Trafficking protein particle complex subunit 6B n=1 Tax=Dispira parvispora TaxID=1520584 RepID=A0A9W8E862_9FUNG|nr:hypothetical protein IWQ62_002247 [Dispira parvispora]